MLKGKQESDWEESWEMCSIIIPHFVYEETKSAQIGYMCCPRSGF